MSQRGFSKLERDEVKLDWDRITQISKVFEMEPMDLVSFDDNLIFNNCTQSGKIQEQHIHNLPDKLIEQCEARNRSFPTHTSLLTLRPKRIDMAQRHDGNRQHHIR